MKLYFAPLEGITTRVYRNAHAEIFGCCDAYFAPFITPSDNEKISRRGLRDVLPEDNKAPLRVQVLTNRVDSFLKFAKKVAALGYEEININLGCPFERVVRKGRGAGFLREPEALETFLDDIFAGCDMKISVKTRTGYEVGGEMERLMAIYNQYPLSCLIIHPRARSDFYRGQPDEAVFAAAYHVSKNPVCYNGNIETAADFCCAAAQYPGLDSVMVGRGAVKNPAVFREIRGGKRLTTQELVAFSERLSVDYRQLLQSETFTLHKLKEVWGYMIQNFPESRKIEKAIKKADRLQDLLAAVQALPTLQTEAGL